MHYDLQINEHGHLMAVPNKINRDEKGNLLPKISQRRFTIQQALQWMQIIAHFWLDKFTAAQRIAVEQTWANEILENQELVKKLFPKELKTYESAVTNAQRLLLSTYHPPYRFVLSEDTMNKIENYRYALVTTLKKPGDYLLSQLGNIPLLSLTNEILVEKLIRTKRTYICADLEVKGDGTDWNVDEISILSDISLVVPVEEVYDDGAHAQYTEDMQLVKFNHKMHPVPFSGHLLFISGALLINKKMNNDLNFTPDLKEVAEITSTGNKLNREQYYELYKRRLFPLFLQANATAQQNNKKALITLSGIGCGCFAGEWVRQLQSELKKVLERMLLEHGEQLKHIHMVYYDPFKHCQPNEPNLKIHHIHFRVRPSEILGKEKAKGQLCHPKDYEESPEDDFSNCELFSVVAGDAFSLPGKEFLRGYKKYTDEGAKAGATNLLSVISGQPGRYLENQMYFPIANENNDWLTLFEKLEMKLKVEGNIYVATKNNQLIPLSKVDFLNAAASASDPRRLFSSSLQTFLGDAAHNQDLDLGTRPNPGG